MNSLVDIFYLNSIIIVDKAYNPCAFCFSYQLSAPGTAYQLASSWLWELTNFY